VSGASQGRQRWSSALREGKERALEAPVPPEDVPGAGLDRPVDIRHSKITFLLGFEFGK
jgi:hypothetical protein